jgi:hypothetical protein
MTLETIGNLTDNLTVSLPAVAGGFGGPTRQGTQILHHAAGHDR